MPKAVIWIPLLLVGAMVYWTLALGFGGLSLMTVTLFQDGENDGSDATEPASLKDSYQPITVNLAGSDEEQAQVADPAEGVPLRVDLVTDHEEAPTAAGQSGQGARGVSKAPENGPGQTAF